MSRQSKACDFHCYPIPVMWLWFQTYSHGFTRFIFRRKSEITFKLPPPQPPLPKKHGQRCFIRLLHLLTLSILWNGSVYLMHWRGLFYKSFQPKQNTNNSLEVGPYHYQTLYLLSLGSDSFFISKLDSGKWIRNDIHWKIKGYFERADKCWVIDKQRNVFLQTR